MNKPILHVVFEKRLAGMAGTVLKPMMDAMKSTFGDEYKIIATPENVDIVADNSTIVNLNIHDKDDLEGIITRLQAIPTIVKNDNVIISDETEIRRVTWGSDILCKQEKINADTLEIRVTAGTGFAEGMRKTFVELSGNNPDVVLSFDSDTFTTSECNLEEVYLELKGEESVHALIASLEFAAATLRKQLEEEKNNDPSKDNDSVD